MRDRLEELTEDFGVTLKHMTEESYKPMTNGDRIRAMSDEELAEEMVFHTGYRESAWSETTYCNLLTGRDDTRENAIKGTIEWLKQPTGEIT